MLPLGTTEVVGQCHLFSLLCCGYIDHSGAGDIKAALFTLVPWLCLCWICCRCADVGSPWLAWWGGGLSVALPPPGSALSGAEGHRPCSAPGCGKTAL